VNRLAPPAPHAPELLALVTAADRHLAQLKDAATCFRKAIERCDPRNLTVCMENFPVGACGDATLLLGTFLQEQGLGKFEYVLGWCADGEVNGRRSHAWMEADGIIVDITADQFSEIDQKVIVTTDRTWHRRFEREPGDCAEDYRVFDANTVSTLGGVYGIILAAMEHS
jgi:hypothetical protein